MFLFLFLVILFYLLANVLLLGAGQSFSSSGSSHVSPAPHSLHTRSPPLRVPVIKGRIPYNLDNKSFPPSMMITKAPIITPIRIAAPSAKLKVVAPKLPSPSNKIEQTIVTPPLKTTPNKDKIEVVNTHKAKPNSKDLVKNVSKADKKQPKVYQAAESNVAKNVKMVSSTFDSIMIITFQQEFN